MPGILLSSENTEHPHFLAAWPEQLTRSIVHASLFILAGQIFQHPLSPCPAVVPASHLLHLSVSKAFNRQLFGYEKSHSAKYYKRYPLSPASSVQNLLLQQHPRVRFQMQLITRDAHGAGRWATGPTGQPRSFLWGSWRPLGDGTGALRAERLPSPRSPLASSVGQVSQQGLCLHTCLYST